MAIELESWAAKFPWAAIQDNDDAWLGFEDDEGTRLVISSISFENATHIAIIHNEWLKRKRGK